MLFQERIENILPKEGVATYVPRFYDLEESNNLFYRLQTEILWKNDEVLIFGKRIVMNRETAWYANTPLEYTYSKVTRKAFLFNDILLKIKKDLELFSGEKFNSCLLNFYHNGEDSMGWHSDDEKTIEENSCIASFSFGAERLFHFKHKKEKLKSSIILENGSLLLMKGEIQKFWLHSLPKSKKTDKPRINLTFRKMIIK
jgi:alkylated DNA repair dioxygenase AlkB